MKKVIRTEFKEIPVEHEITCDFNPNEKGVVFLEIHGGYGSDFDLISYKFDLSNYMADELLRFLETRLPEDKCLKNFATSDYKILN